MFSTGLNRLFGNSWSHKNTRRAKVTRGGSLSESVLRLEDRLMLAGILGTAESFAVLGASTVTNTGPTIISGNLGVSPGAAVTGFPPGVVVPPGTIHAADAVALQAQSDVTIAYNDLAGRASNFNLTGQDLGGLTLVPGVYTFSSSAQLTGTLTLDAQGDPNAEFIFQIGSAITTATNSSVELINGADSCNVYWQVGSSATLGTNTEFAGSILALTSITLVTDATILNGRALARNGAVTMDSNQISIDGCGSITWEKRATDGNPVLLGGATFQITPNPQTGVGTLIVVDGGANDADGVPNGVLKVNEVLIGTYTITETIAPAGYAIDDDATRSVTVSFDDFQAVVGTQGSNQAGNTNESDFHNRLGSIAWEKRATDANPILLAGATFLISPDPLDGVGTLIVVDGGVNDADGLANGVLQINNVLLGTYIITETISPAGYAIDDDATRSITVTTADLNAVVGTQGVNNVGNTNESDFHNRLLVVIGMGKSQGVPQFVTVLDQENGDVFAEFAPYGNAFRGGVRIATGELSGSGTDEIVTAPGWGIVAQVRVYNQSGRLLTSFEPYGPNFKGGVQVAVADVDGDGLSDIITVPSLGAAQVKVFRNVLVAGRPAFDASRPYRNFLAFPASFIGGAVMAAADMGSTPPQNGSFDNTRRDGKAEIVVGSSAGTKTTVKVFDVSRMAASTPDTVPAASRSFTPFSTLTTSYQGGVTLSVARINADPIPDIVVGAGVNGGSLVDAWAWSNTPSAQLSSLSTNGTGFAAFTDASRTAPVQVAAQDTTSDGIADTILVAQGPGGTTNQIRSFNIISASPLRVSRPTPLVGRFPGPYFIAALNDPSSAAVIRTFAESIDREPVVITPVGNINSLTPTISWKAIPGAVRYELWVSNQSTLERVIHFTHLTATTFHPTASLPLGSYRVWIRAFNSKGIASAWSLPANFTIGKNKAAPAAGNPLPMLTTKLLAKHVLTMDDFFSDKFLLDEVLLTQPRPDGNCVAADSDELSGEEVWSLTEHVGCEVEQFG